MKVLFIKERTHKLDVMENAVLKTFSQCEDIVTIATIQVGSVLNTVSQIKELIKQYQPDVVHLHNLHANYVNVKRLLSFLGEQDIPTVITLHDCWFFTGKCTHYTSIKCNKWQTGCEKCPSLKKDIPSWFFDCTQKMWKDLSHEKMLSVTDHCCCSVVSDSLQPHGLQHARLPCLSHLPEFAQTHVH